MLTFDNFANASKKKKSLQKGRTRKQKIFYDREEEKEGERRMDGKKVRRKEGWKFNAIKTSRREENNTVEESKSRERWKWRERKKV
jgi:hypothetical protein